MKKEFHYDEIGYWSEVKLDIIKDYATQYSLILSRQTQLKLHHVYIDAFAGAGKHSSKTTKEFILGSPANALLVEPPFKEFHFIDLNEEKSDALKELSEGKGNVFVYNGDCNKILLNQVLPRAKYENYRRALCILDPYGLHLDWKVIETIGKMKSIEFFLNFPIADMNRNVLLHQQNKVQPSQIERMNLFWGDDSWHQAAYKPSLQPTFFGDRPDEKTSNEAVVEAFRERLKKVARFSYVPKPVAMKNSTNAVVYYLFFASHKPVAAKIVTHIFKKYENWMES